MDRNFLLLSSKTRDITNSVNIRLALTEENLDYLLRQEYALSQMCYKADQLTLDALNETKNIRPLKGSEKNVTENKPLNTTLVKEQNDLKGEFNSASCNIRSDQMDVELEDAACEYSLDQGNLKMVTMKTGGEISNSDVNDTKLIRSCMSGEGKYGYNLKFPLKEKRVDIKTRTIGCVNRSRYKNYALNHIKIGHIEIEDILCPVLFKTLKIIHVSRGLETHKTLILNCDINYIPRVVILLQPFNHLKLFCDMPILRMKNENFSHIVTENLIFAIQSLLLKENCDYNVAAKRTGSCPLFLETINRSNDLNLTSSQEINILSTTETKSELSTSKIVFMKGFYEETEVRDTLLTTDVVPSKSNLKRKISVQKDNKKNKLKKSGLKFTNVTTFYFERSQGFSSIPTKGGSTLGMIDRHFYINTIPIDEYEHSKLQREMPKRRTNNLSYRKTEMREKLKSVQALSLNQRIELLESAEVQIEQNEEDECAYIRSSRASAGCDCKDYCDPDVCGCSLSGIECQVDRPNFPCGCSQENCKNVMGRNEYNHMKVRSHFTKTIKKVRVENKGRVSKRKQASPNKVFIHNFDTTIDVDMIQV